MAVTKIWPVKGRLDAVIRYAGNEEKTRLPDLTGLSAGKDDLSDVLQYAANDAQDHPGKSAVCQRCHTVCRRLPASRWS